MYSLVLSLLFLSILLIYIAASSSDTLFAAILQLPFFNKLTFAKTLSTNQKYLGIGTAIVVILISSSLASTKLSSLSKRLLSLMSEYKPLMSNRKWNPGSSRQMRPSRESRLAHKNGGEIGGLGNEGNTCFMNSVLQALASSNSLLKFFNDNIYEDTEVHTEGQVLKMRTGSLNSHMRFTAALKSLLDDLNGKYGSRGKEFSTRVLMKKMPDGPKQNFFMGYNQEDAQEFYQSVMRIVEKEYKKAFSSKSPSPEPEVKEEKAKFVSASDIAEVTGGCENLGKLGTVYVPAHQIDPNIPDSENLLAPLELVTPVDGVTAERIGCIMCGETGGIRYSVNSGLSLNLPFDRSYRTQYELLQLLNEWKKPELIDDVNCNRCGLIQTKEFLQENIEGASNEKLIETFSKRAEEIDQELEKDYISDEVFERLTTKQMIRKTTKSKQILMSRPPPLLCIHINRSVIDPHTFMIMKNSKSVSFPAVLDLNNYVADPDSINMDARLPFSKRDELLFRRAQYTDGNSMEDGENSGSESMSGEAQDETPETQQQSSPEDSQEDSQEGATLTENEQLKYQLKAVISHMGTHNYGHYICYRRWRGTWWKANDESVYTTTEEEVLSSPGTFMLFYELKDAAEDDYKPLSDDEKNSKEEVDASEPTSRVSSSSSSEDENDANSTASSWEETRNGSEQDSKDLFPNAQFELGEERAYHV